MIQLKEFLLLLFTQKFLSKFAAYILLIVVFYIFSDFLGIFLMVFIFAYLFYVLAEFIKIKLDLFWVDYCSKSKTQLFLKRLFWLNFIITSIYILFIWVIIFIVSDMVPKLINELSDLPKNIPFLAEPVSQVTNKLVEIKNFNSELWGSINQIVTNQDVEVVLDILSKLKSASVIFLQVIISIILSYVFLIDRKRLRKYLLGIKKSSFSFLYKEYKIIFDKVLKSFGLIFKAQAMIAFTNTVLTTLWLFFIGWFHWLWIFGFPYLTTLALIVFIAWFIPVLGTFLSSIPILIIGYSIIWGYTIIIEIVLLIAIIHTIEAYFLNPKIISKFIEVPVSLTFIILIVSEHFFWIAWLLIWVSLFYFIVGLLKDADNVIKKKSKKLKKEEEENKTLI